jgi:flotillin
LKAAAQRDTAIKLAGYQAEQDWAAAAQAQAGPLADAEARKQVVVQETEVAELEAQREEKRLETTVRKPADAAAYQARVEAEGQREARIALAEAAKRETELKAEADARRVELGAQADAKRVELAAAATASRPARLARRKPRPPRPEARPSAPPCGPRASPKLKPSPSAPTRSAPSPRQSSANRSPRSFPQIVEAAAGAFRGVDDLTVLNGAQGIGEIMNQIIGQAGPTLELAKRALATNGNPTRPAPGATREAPTEPTNSAG